VTLTEAAHLSSGTQIAIRADSDFGELKQNMTVGQ
jgi:hypothetical protein